MSKLSDAECEAAETQVRLEFCRKCNYLDGSVAGDLLQAYDYILGKLVTMMRHAEKWTL